ncbi:hypothetical protein FB446DRAFT_329745 [Lentinula raphanica]|nr:hypothetical protein FB446DRAFT_329745 [Lentinula raphanica]
MSGGVGGPHQSEMTQDGPGHGIANGAAEELHYYTTNEPDAVKDMRGIQATLHISSALNDFYQFPTLSAYQRPVQKMLDTVERKTLLEALKSKDSKPTLRSNDVEKVFITKVVADNGIENRDAFILSFSLYVPKEKKKLSSVSKLDTHYTGEIVWDGCIENIDSQAGRYQIHHKWFTGELRDNQDKALVSYEDGKHVGSIEWAGAGINLLYHPDLDAQTNDFKKAFALAVEKLLAPLESSHSTRDRIKEEIPTLPNVQWIFDWQVIHKQKADLANNQNFQIALINVFDRSGREWSAPNDNAAPVYAGRFDWRRSLKKDDKGLYRLLKYGLTGEIRDLRDGKVLVLFEGGKQKIPAPESTIGRFFKKDSHV